MGASRWGEVSRGRGYASPAPASTTELDNDAAGAEGQSAVGRSPTAGRSRAPAFPGRMQRSGMRPGNQQIDVPKAPWKSAPAQHRIIHMRRCVRGTKSHWGPEVDLFRALQARSELRRHRAAHGVEIRVHVLERAEP